MDSLKSTPTIFFVFAFVTLNFVIMSTFEAPPKLAFGVGNGALECTSYGHKHPTLCGFSNRDFIDISVIDGFNLPMEFSSNSPQCSRVIKCVGNIIGECPAQLRMSNACKGACPMLKTEEHCCNSGNCGPTDLSRFFKQRCPDAYSYPKDDPPSTCPTGTNYKVILCP
ncbi:PREDICTED: protein P21-like [Tarenaya hassleriana]|uniref:protein P21-like n=1 Tax=Tarenaya hassleriana TaxID=28532 RepID=UPI0008FD82E6|nr:PREDICTED: protein P21-like [Tarenaya hassleriana]